MYTALTFMQYDYVTTHAIWLCNNNQNCFNKDIT